MFFSTVLGGMISAMFYCKNKFLGFHCVNQNSSLNFKYYNVFSAIMPLYEQRYWKCMGISKYTYIYMYIYMVGIYGKCERCSKAADY